MATVSLKALTKIYDRHHAPAADKVSLDIEHGEFMVLLGPSGCGKTTTLRMIAGLESISSGTLAIDHQAVNHIPAKDRDIAMVFQSYALYPHMSVRNNLAFGLRRRSVSKDEINSRVESVATTLKLDGLLNRKPHALSGGQRQRVALGRAIVRDPKVFLFDEPLSNLDAALRVSTRTEIADLHRRLGATMIYVTHDQVEAMTLGSRICIMSEGRVMQVGRPLDVYRHPENVFVAGFLGNPPMNLIRTKLVTEADVVKVQLGSKTIKLPEHYAKISTTAAEVTLGIRPEHLSVVATATQEAIPVSVTQLELLGAETIATFALIDTGDKITARLGGNANLEIGERCAVKLNTEAVKLFAADGNALDFSNHNHERE